MVRIHQPRLPYNASVSDIEIGVNRIIRGLQTRKLKLDAPVAQGKPSGVLSYPEVESLVGTAVGFAATSHQVSSTR